MVDPSQLRNAEWVPETLAKRLAVGDARIERRDFESLMWADDLVFISHRSLAGAIDSASGRSRMVEFVSGVLDVLPNFRQVIRDGRASARSSVLWLTTIHSDDNGNYMVVETVARFVDGDRGMHVTVFDEGTDKSRIVAEMDRLASL